MFSTLGLLPGCASWFGGVDYDLRQANNRFNYLDDVAQNREIKQPVGTDPIKFNEKFSLPKPILDSRAALIGKEVDVRPPQKIMKLDSNIIGFQDGDLALVWFFPDEDGHQVTTNEVFTTIFRLFRKLGITLDKIEAQEGIIQTDWYESTEAGLPYTLNSSNKGLVRYRQRFSFKLGANKDGVPGVQIQLTDNIIEKSDGTELIDGLNRFEPARFTAQMANKLIASYSQDLKAKNNINDPNSINIELGHDNNNLSSWIVKASFKDTFKALEQLFIDYEIKIDKYSSTKGEIKVSYDEFDPEFWEENNIEPWGLESGDYLFKIGVYDNMTTISLYDKHDQPVDSAVTIRMYSGFADSLGREFKKLKESGAFDKDEPAIEE